ncbi:MAG TPA: DUF2092 domain-containing protein [Rhizomicrobium sp.]|nr:DUF2092 domain-containing protein [Rhizomicrobium sp.]
MVIRQATRAAVFWAVMAIPLLPRAHADEPAPPVKPAISEEANAAVSQMEKTLLSKEFSFTAKTIRVFQDQSGQPLHIFHSMDVVVRRPDRLSVRVNGDDGAHDLLYDGKSVSLYLPADKKYATVSAPGEIASALDTVTNKLGTDFPLADFFTDAPGKSFLSGVVAGWQVGTADIGGTNCRHLFFTQQAGIDLELWVENNAASTPRRLIVTYRLLPGQPNFVAEFSDWNFGAKPTDAEFAFTPPAGATKIDFNRAGAFGGMERK